MFVGNCLGTGRVDQLGVALNADHFTLGTSYVYFPFEQTSPPLTPDDFGHGEYDLTGGRASFGNVQNRPIRRRPFSTVWGRRRSRFRLTVGGEYARVRQSVDHPLPHNLDGGLFPSQASLVLGDRYEWLHDSPLPRADVTKLSGGSLKTSSFSSTTPERSARRAVPSELTIWS